MATDLAQDIGMPPDWQTLTNTTLPSGPYLFIDGTSPSANSRY